MARTFRYDDPLFSRMMPLLSGLQRHDPSGYEHSLRVAATSLDTAIALGFDEFGRTIIARSALFHDVGKRGISCHILRKEGELDEAEREAIKKHVDIGFKLVREFDHTTARIVAGHHLFSQDPYPKDTTKYSHAPTNGEPSLDAFVDVATQIVAINDMADALLRSRPYKGAFPDSDVREILKDQFTGNHDLIEPAIEANRPRSSRPFVSIPLYE